MDEIIDEYTKYQPSEIIIEQKAEYKIKIKYKNELLLEPRNTFDYQGKEIQKIILKILENYILDNTIKEIVYKYSIDERENEEVTINGNKYNMKLITSKFNTENAFMTNILKMLEDHKRISFIKLMDNSIRTQGIMTVHITPSKKETSIKSNMNCYTIKYKQDSINNQEYLSSSEYKTLIEISRKIIFDKKDKITDIEINYQDNNMSSIIIYIDSVIYMKIEGKALINKLQENKEIENIRKLISENRRNK